MKETVTIYINRISHTHENYIHLNHPVTITASNTIIAKVDVLNFTTQSNMNNYFIHKYDFFFNVLDVSLYNLYVEPYSNNGSVLLKVSKFSSASFHLRAIKITLTCQINH